MKRLKRLLLASLAVMLTLPATPYASAENTEGWRADLTQLLRPEQIPATTTIRYNLKIQDDGTAPMEEVTRSVELVSSKGDVLNVQVTFALDGMTPTDEQWQTIQSWLKGVVTSSVQSIKADSESLASVVATAIYDARKAAQANGDTTEVWADPGLLVKTVSASVPYFPTLQKGDSGSSTKRLQRRLIELGFLNDAADGHYGGNTEDAVKALENHVREVEQELIDTRPAPTAIPMPTATPSPAPYVIPLAVAQAEPEVAAPTMAPEPTPATAVDGIADPLLQAYLYSNNFRITLGTLGTSAIGGQVSRVQRRLQNLGYTVSVPDGQMGSATARAIRVFQYFNQLEPTGVADAQTQAVLFSADAVKPGNEMLAQGSKGEAVSKLQTRLKVLGFANINVDGDYGDSTRTAVETLQKYMQVLEAQTIKATTGQTPETSQLTNVVNGVADPLLLKDFYSDAFPAIPAALGSGSTGPDVVRVQRRLSMLEYYDSKLDGEFGAGTMKAIQDFQKQHKLNQTATADRQTLEVLFSEDAHKAMKPYILKVSVANQRVYAYGLDDNNQYTDLVRTMKCSTGRSGTPTPKGTYTSSTAPGARWHYFKKFDCWAQYAYYIQGDIMFHSVLYNTKESSPTRSSVNNLGSRASHGCVRLAVEDAKWIWTNCPKRTTVIVE